MHTVNSEIDIDLPVRTVYNQWTQFESFPAFMTGVEEVRQIDDTTNFWRVTVGGVEREFNTQITEQEPDMRVAWKSTAGPQHAGVVTFHRLNGDQTRVKVQLDWDPEGFLENVGAAFQVDDMRVQGDLKEFKRLIESNGFETGAWRGSVDQPNQSAM
ncbi:MAG: SRPBCC family protein [Microbacteriaceae bacterium]|nr:SRPBCC family protein [Microbacteriaceae bacterium]